MRCVLQVGVIALPEVTEYELTTTDEFLVLASDGIWEFIDNQEAAEVVQGHFDEGKDAAGACKGLIELANRRWSEMVGDYRDDITATIVRLPFLPPADTPCVTRSRSGSFRAHSPGTGAKEKAAHALTPTPSSGTTPVPVESRNGHNNHGVSARIGEARVEGSCTTPEPPGPPKYAGGKRTASTAPEGASRSTGVIEAGDDLTASDAAPGDENPHRLAANDARAEARAASDVTYTPAVTPDECASEPEDDEAASAASAETMRLLSAVAEVFTEGDRTKSTSKIDSRGGAEEGAGAAATASDSDADRKVAKGEEPDGNASHEADSEEDEWELEFGARDNREPSREMREASKEFPVASVHELEELVSGIDPLDDDVRWENGLDAQCAARAMP